MVSFSDQLQELLDRAHPGEYHGMIAKLVFDELERLRATSRASGSR